MDSKEGLNLHDKEIATAALLFRAINNRFRQNLLRYMHTHHKLTVTQIYTHFKKSQAYISQQLGILRKAGLVEFTRDKTSVTYFIRYESLEKLKHFTALLVRR
jgi:DNA-binding transcriptional ArsR family regulator